ncbi:alpha/beta fold hydrolase [Ideonella paludis]|uniref:alpha/beta fold hydrolase n=1 Tax=Ideonella paludis TaxID=1233411 RepID=UPI003633F2BE
MPADAPAQTLRDVAYASRSAAQKMDIYMPAGAGPFPAVVLIHGGAFKRGDKAMDAANAAALVAQGYVAVAINYRLSGEATFPAAVHDAKAAVRFLRARASDYRIQPSKIGVWGASAGGHLAAMLGTSGGVAELEGTEGAHLGVSSRVQAVVDWFGPINFATMVSEGRALGFAAHYNVDNESAYLGVDANSPAHLALVQRSNPATYIDAQDPPFFIQVGSADPLIPYTQSLNFHAALKAVLGEAKVSVEKLEGAGHGGPQFGSAANLSKVLGFLGQHLK